MKVNLKLFFLLLIIVGVIGCNFNVSATESTISSDGVTSQTINTIKTNINSQINTYREQYGESYERAREIIIEDYGYYDSTDISTRIAVEEISGKTRQQAVDEIFLNSPRTNPRNMAQTASRIGVPLNANGIGDAVRELNTIDERLRQNNGQTGLTNDDRNRNTLIRQIADAPDSEFISAIGSLNQNNLEKVVDAKNQRGCEDGSTWCSIWNGRTERTMIEDGIREIARGIETEIQTQGPTSTADAINTYNTRLTERVNSRLTDLKIGCTIGDCNTLVKEGDRITVIDENGNMRSDEITENEIGKTRLEVFCSRNPGSQCEAAEKALDTYQQQRRFQPSIGTYTIMGVLNPDSNAMTASRLLFGNEEQYSWGSQRFRQYFNEPIASTICMRKVDGSLNDLLNDQDPNAQIRGSGTNSMEQCMPGYSYCINEVIATLRADRTQIVYATNATFALRFQLYLKAPYKYDQIYYVPILKTYIPSGRNTVKPFLVGFKEIDSYKPGVGKLAGNQSLAYEDQFHFIQVNVPKTINASVNRRMMMYTAIYHKADGHYTMVGVLKAPVGIIGEGTTIAKEMHVQGYSNVEVDTTEEDTETNTDSDSEDDDTDATVEEDPFQIAYNYVVSN